MKGKVREAILAYLFLIPSFLILGTFVFWPVAFSFVLSFFRWDFKNMRNPVFAGFENYREIFRFFPPMSHSFLEALLWTVFLVAMSTCFVIALYSIFRRNILPWLLLFTTSIAYFLNFQLVRIIAVGISILLLVITVSKFHQYISKHLYGLVAAAIGSTTLMLAFDARFYTIVNFLLEGRDRNLFIKAMFNTLYYVVLSVPITIALALAIALLLNTNIKLRAFFRTAYFVPFVTSIVAISLVWRWIFDDAYGLLNYFLSFFNIQKIAWLKDERWTIPTVAIVSIWRTVGYDAVIFLAGLQSIDRSYYEAAEVDGASSWQKFLHITWPLLSPTTFFLLIVSLINAFKVFTEVYVLYSGLPGPYNNSGLTMVYYVFDRFYVQQRMGIACAAAYVLFAIILIFTLIQFRVGRNVVEYVS
ncbi:carbohydrate ABC transporter permease [Pseudothermotoga sp.]|nr:sugar ABC transporter permease [Pseudothermotoga sp.]MDW8140367.1 sugar ABC transporter permease [Pseudothermotoga sp.]